MPSTGSASLKAASLHPWLHSSARSGAKRTRVPAYHGFRVAQSGDAPPVATLLRPLRGEENKNPCIPRVPRRSKPRRSTRGYTPPPAPGRKKLRRFKWSPAETPTLVATALPATLQIQLRINKGGFRLVAIDLRRGDGAWVHLGVSQLATFTDTTPPLVAGQPERREYRCQGMEVNDRIGDVSPTISIVTVP